MRVTRRSLLKAGGVACSSLPFTGCERVISRITKEFGETIPDQFAIASNPEIDQHFHLLSRAAYGPWPGDLDRVRQRSSEGWIEEQLNPEAIDDTFCDLRARRFETIHHSPGTCYEYKKHVLREEIARHTLLRAVYSRRQLFEVMVSFWTDHLNIDIEKGDCIYLKPSDDRLVIRANALGRFKDLIRASATSPAMLVYLDGNENRRATPDEAPNENYARELLELHTLGVHGGYTQQDVYEIARCLTGWRVRSGWRRGTVYFDPALHDDGEKRVLGRVISAGGGERDIDQVIEIVCSHPATARHIAKKLSHKFVSDQPPASLVDRIAAVFTSTDGDITEVVRAILTSEEFQASKGSKIKRPFHFVVSCLRSLGADTHAHQPLIEYLNRMGQGLFSYPTPDGYPDESAAWLGTLLWRWNLAFELTSNRIPSVSVDLERLDKAMRGDKDNTTTEAMFSHLIGRAANDRELQAMKTGKTERKLSELVALALSSPAFQRC